METKKACLTVQRRVQENGPVEQVVGRLTVHYAGEVIVRGTMIGGDYRNVHYF